MQTVQDIINRALRKIGILSAGATAPNTADNQLCLDALIALFQHQITSGAFGELYDVIPTTTAYTANENERIVNDGTITVTLPTEITKWSYDDVYGCPTWVEDTNMVRPPRDLSVIEVNNTNTGVVGTYIYDSRTRDWFEINSLTYSNPCPLALRDANGLACLLALNVAPEFGQQPDQLTTDAAFKYQTALSHNYSQGGNVIDPPDYF